MTVLSEEGAALGLCGEISKGATLLQQVLKDNCNCCLKTKGEEKLGKKIQTDSVLFPLVLPQNRKVTRLVLSTPMI